MLAPIPPQTMVGEGSSRQLRPSGLGLTAVLMCAFNCLGLVSYDPAKGSLAAFLILYAVVGVISFIAIWYYWRGQNWARWLVCLTSVIAVLSLTTLASATLGAKVLGIVEAAFGVWMLYWLNTKPVVLYFRSTPRKPAVGKAALVTFGVIVVVGALVFGAIGLSMLYSPTPRPVYGDRIATAHRQALSILYPDDEQLLGLFSMGTFEVIKVGCLFTDKRVVIFEEGKIVRQAMFAEVQDLQLFRERRFVGMSELTVEREDGNRLYCRLPNASAYPNDAAEFRERIADAWRRVKERVAPK